MSALREEEFDEEVQQAISKIKLLPMFQHTAKKYGGVSEKSHCLLISVLELIIGEGRKGRKITKEGIHYLKRYLKKQFNFPTEMVSTTLDIYLTDRVNKNSGTGPYVEYLAAVFRKKQKIKFIETLFVISLYDTKAPLVTNKELKNLSYQLRVSNSHSNSALATAKIIIDNQLDLLKDGEYTPG